MSRLFDRDPRYGHALVLEVSDWVSSLLITDRATDTTIERLEDERTIPAWLAFRASQAGRVLPPQGVHPRRRDPRRASTPDLHHRHKIVTTTWDSTPAHAKPLSMLTNTLKGTK